MSGVLLAGVMRDPTQASRLAPDAWNALISAARAEQMIGNLAVRLQDQNVPAAVQPILADARAEAVVAHRRALWEVDRAREALEPLGIPMILLKGSAYVAAGLTAGEGRSIGDLDILVPRASLDPAEAALLAAGWEWVKPDPYDDAYYRQWMHELPPLIHRERDRMIDVHHTILPLTARPKPDADSLIANAMELEGGLRVLSREHMVIHAAAHLIADGDLSGGLRNLWDIDQLCREFSVLEQDFYLSLYEESWAQGLGPDVVRVLRLAQQIYGTPAIGYVDPVRIVLDEKWSDAWFRRRLLARDGWGRTTRPLTRLAFYIRSHWLRMPPTMLVRHLFTKWRKRSA